MSVQDATVRPPGYHADPYTPATVVEGDDTVRKWVHAIHDYEIAMRSQSKSERTIVQRRYQLGVLAEEHLARSPWRVSTEQLVRWLASYDWSPATRASYVATVRAFYKWATDSGRTKRNPAERLTFPKVPKPLPRPAPESIVDRALARATDKDTLIVLLSELAGLRRAEVAALRWEHIGDGQIRVVAGKGGKSRAVPLDDTLADALAAEHDRRTHGEYGSGFRYHPASDHGWVFPSRKGGHVTPHAIGEAASKLLGPGWSHHTLRHRFGTTAYQISGDIRIVSDLMGHARLDTTAGYARIPGDAHRRVIDGIGQRRRIPKQTEENH